MAGERKDQVPPRRRHIIKRPRLTRILDESAARVLMLVAPAGYGKTTLAREWLENKRHVWYQGGPASADVAALAVGLADVFGQLVPNAGERMRARLRATKSPEEDVEPLAELLVEDLAAWPDDAWIAIDDYQFAMGSAASENFVELVHRESELRLFIGTRDRPTWVTARQLMYGEIHELSRISLALNQEEATQILATVGREEAFELLALADGWPAVIGLASLAVSDSFPDETPSALYDFFAQELYDGLEAEAQAGFSTLAIASTVTRMVADFLLDSSARILELGESAGILTSEGAEGYVMHPLLRRFFLDRVSDHGIALDSLAERLYGFYCAGQAWDDAFAVIELAEITSRLSDLLEAALPTLLIEGRLSTLKRWLSWGDEREVDSSACDLAAAEIAFREGDVQGAEARAAQLTRRLPREHSLRAPAFLLAGKAAMMANQAEKALEYLETAASAECSEPDTFEITWTRLVAAARLERPEALEFLQKLDENAVGIPDRELRRVIARLAFGVRMGSLEGLDDLFHSNAHLLSRAQDPLVRSSFLVSQAHLLAMTAQYREAREAIEHALDEVSAYGLDFARPHALMIKALIHLGLCQFSQAASLISITEGVGEELRNVFIAMNSTALRARLLLLQGATSQAVSLFERPWPSAPERSMHAEYLATHAVALAADKRCAEAIRQADESSLLSNGIEAAVLNAAARALAADERTTQLDESAAHLLQTVARTGNYDALILACRLSSELLDRLATCDSGGVLTRAVYTAGDQKLACHIGLALPVRLETECLTPREREVYELLAHGLTNREIAAALFISESTAKLHTLHVRRKLGLRSRTEVALHANATGGYAASATEPSSDHGS